MDHLRQQVRTIAASRGVALAEAWRGIDPLLPLLEKIREDGVLVVLKLTGVERSTQPYMALFTGGPLQRDFVRVTGTTLEEATCHAILNYARRAWMFSE